MHVITPILPVLVVLQLFCTGACVLAAEPAFPAGNVRAEDGIEAAGMTGRDDRIDTKRGVEQDLPGRSGYFNTLTLTWENDAFTGTDRDYTNGLKLTWSTPYGEMDEASLPSWTSPVFKHLPFVGLPGGKRALSLAIGQDIYIPEDTDQSGLIEDDRPYAGYTYLAAGFHARRSQRMDLWQISLGIVGPASLAEDIQNLTHDMIGVDRARGWDNQLSNEVTIDALYESQWRLWSSSRSNGIDFDLIPHLGGRIGTLKTYLNAGAELRMGWNLPNDFGSCPIRGGCETNSAFYENNGHQGTFHFFLSGDGQAVARDIFLDGNTFTDSHSVDKKTFVGELMGGFVWQTGRMKLTYAHIYQTRQFDTQKDNPVYGSLSLAWTY